MKLLVDANIGHAMKRALAAHDLLLVSDLPPRTSDLHIIRLAALEGRVVITADKDFGELVYRCGEPCHGVIHLRIAAPSELERVATLVEFWPAIEAAAPGHFVVVSTRGIRRSPLP